jgi:biopolymer transport protein ExbD
MNLTPLVDVMMVLMIIFHGDQSHRSYRIDLTLPDAETAPVPRSNETLVVAMDANLRIRAALGTQPGLDATLVNPANVLRTHFAGHTRAHVKADRALSVQDFMTLLFA